MAQITKVSDKPAAQPTVFMDVFGKGWNNSKNGRDFITFRISRGMSVQLAEGDVIIARPNRKREGMKDADWQMGIIPQAQGNT